MDRARRIDLLLALVVAVAEVSNLLLVGDAGHRGIVSVALLVASALPLAVWHRFPFAVSLTAAVPTILLAVLEVPHLGLAVLASAFGVATWSGTRTRRVSLATLVVGVPLVPYLVGDAASIPKDVALYAAAWILGALLRERRAYTAALEERTRELERERERSAALAAGAERARIARELHDVLTHSVSVMVIQAQAAQAAHDPAQVDRALARIEAVGKSGLVELRRLLQRLRAEDESPLLAPPRGLAQLDELLAEVRAAGLDVSLSLEGEVRPLPASVDLSAYRIVQEALTNTLRHAGTAAAEVVLRYRPEELALEVLDDGRAQPSGASQTGHGVAGMRERAALVGGSLVAEDVPGGGFRVAARMPLEAGL